MAERPAKLEGDGAGFGDGMAGRDLAAKNPARPRQDSKVERRGLVDGHKSGQCQSWALVERATVKSVEAAVMLSHSYKGA